ncbi:DNA adenine methylase [Candidatus Chlorohelix sp.]|uniref:DNA adenine methylase n=1 Tax=Candidatus Chlorohelix sp. TaxID=3139201 RepID=UPI00303A3DEA
MQQVEVQLNLEGFALKIKPEPVLKWVGGKGQLLAQFQKFMPTHFNHYFEPFVGSAALFFHLQPKVATLNDFNPNLIGLYRDVQNQLEELLQVLAPLRACYHSLSPESQEKEYYRLRNRYNQLPTGVLEKSALLIFLNKTGYNGLYRENSQGGYNVPFGRYDNPSMFSEEKLRAVAVALEGVRLLNSDFEQAVENASKGDFVYFDPPYMPLSKTSSFTGYTKEDFGQSSQERLAGVVRRLVERGVQVMLSNSDTEFIRKLYWDFQIHEVKASRAINSKPDARGKITELVITNY